jgi:imidazolonepropionase-like amidohydrolase
MSKPIESKLSDADMQEAPRALLRAAQRAREIARQKGTGVVILRDGKIVEVSPDDDAEDFTPPSSAP